MVNRQHFQVKTLKNFFVLTFLFISFLFTACEGDLNDTGIGGLDRDKTGGYLRKDTIHTESVTHVRSFMDSVYTGNAQRLYLGQTGGNAFRMIFYFSIGRSLDSVTVKQGVRFRLISAGSYGTGNVTATVHPVLRDWTESDVRWNRFEFGRDFGPSIAQFQVSSSDTQKSVINITLPRDTVQNWVWAVSDTNRTNFGILIDFQDGAPYTHQFYGGGVTVSSSDITPDASYAPQLIFHWQKFNTQGQLTQDSATIFPVTLSSGMNRFSGGRQGILYRETNPLPSDQLWIGSGIPYHSFIRFSTDSLPKASTISHALMILRIDTTAGDFNRSKTRTIQTVRVETDPAEWAPGKIALDNIDSYLINFGASQNRWLTCTTSGDTLKFNITEQAQSWVSKPASNKGLQIFNGDELKGNFNDLYKLRIVNDPADAERSPKIVIYYTVPPESD